MFGRRPSPSNLCYPSRSGRGTEYSVVAGRAIVPETRPDGISLRATVSAGVAILDPTEATPEALLRAADVGLFLAKRGGRNRVVVT